MLFVQPPSPEVTIARHIALESIPWDGRFEIEFTRYGVAKATGGVTVADVLECVEEFAEERERYKYKLDCPVYFGGRRCKGDVERK